MEAQVYFDLLPLELIGEIALYLYVNFDTSIKELCHVNYRLFNYLSNKKYIKDIIVKWYPTWYIVIQDYSKLNHYNISPANIYHDAFYYIQYNNSRNNLEELIVKEKLYRNHRHIYDDLNKININLIGAAQIEGKLGFNFSWNEFYNQIMIMQTSILDKAPVTTKYVKMGIVDTTNKIVYTPQDLNLLKTMKYSREKTHRDLIYLLCTTNTNFNLDIQDDEWIFIELMVAFNLCFNIFNYLIRKMSKETLDRILKNERFIRILEQLPFRPCFDY